MRYICTSIVATLVLAGTSLAATINVPADYTTIQAAIDAASNGDEILVAPGMYTDTQDGHVVDMKGKSILLRSLGGPEVTVIDGENARRGIACFRSEYKDCVIDGFTIRNGYGVPHDYDASGGTDHWEDDGGGILTCLNSHPTIRNCIITNGSAVNGGGIGCYETYPTIIGCTISNNTAEAGGGIFLSGSRASFIDCTISGNSASDRGGGVLSINDSDAGFFNCTISNNAADSGGGIYLSGSPTLTDCTITGNVAANNGGGMVWEDSSLSMIGCLVDSNSAINGGGIWNTAIWGTQEDNIPLLDSCIISNNTASENEGGIYLRFHNANMIDCSFTGNEAVAGSGGGVSVSRSSATFIRCLINENFAGANGGGVSHYKYQLQFIDCLIVNNTAGIDGGGYIRWKSGNDALFSGTSVCSNTADQIYGTWRDLGNNTVGTTCIGMGACCLDDSCWIDSEDDCVASDGSYVGDNTACTDCPPPDDDPYGACCANGLCVSITLEECFEIEGSYAGDEVACADAGCPTYCDGDTNKDGTVNMTDLLTVIADWGICP